jgi:hypothetical protein
MKRGRGTRPHFAKGKLWCEADFDPLLPSQVFGKAIYNRPASGEERMAWRFLERNILDTCQGRQKARLKFVTELEEWMAAGEQAPYSFAYWCSLLGVEEPFMRDKFSAFLVEQRENALAGRRGNFKILRQIEAVRIEQPHLLTKTNEPEVMGQPLYECLSCHLRGNMSYFLSFTCVRTQPPAESGLKRLWCGGPQQHGHPDVYESHCIHTQEKGHYIEESNSQPLNACNEHHLQDQGSRPNQQLDNGSSEGRCADGSGVGCPSGVGAVAAGPASAGSPTDV